MLQLIDVTKKYNDFTALSHVNLTLDHGIYGLLAPNGAGKTTLMKMMATLLFPTQGQILCDGQDIIRMDGDYREKLGYLPQQFGYYRDYTPKKYLKYLGLLKGMEKSLINQRTEKVLEMTGLGDVMNKKMKKFSGGMIQRVGIAQALLGDPEILILDEPTAGLDPKERMRFGKILSQLSKNKIVIISTHIVSDIEFIANRIIMLKDQTVLCNSTVGEICDEIDGLVYEAAVDASLAARYEQSYQILSRRQEGHEIVLRFISKMDCQDWWRRCAPGLEDFFLYTYQDGDCC